MTIVESSRSDPQRPQGESEPEESTPLLQSQNQIQKSPAVKRTPLPWFQFSLVLFLQLAEPLTSQVISPFAPQLIRDIGITNGDESKVGYYVGLMHSLFFLTQAFTVLNWSRLSDRIGRKPVLLTGLFGLSASMYCFGLSRTFWGLVLSRCLNGALNGNIGVMKSIIAEITDSTNISLAYAYQPIPWSLGCVLGPMIGGALARPVDQFPAIFLNWGFITDFFKTYPYFLPCAVPATFSLIAWLVTYTWFKETLSNPRPIRELLAFRKSDKKIDTDDSTKKTDSNTNEITVPESEQPYPVSKLMSMPQVILAGTNYALLSLVEIAFRAIQPLYYSTPVHMGGLGLSPSSIGKILSLYGLFNGTAQVFFFADLHDALGSKKTFLLGISCGFPLFGSYMLLSMLAGSPNGFGSDIGIGGLSIWIIAVLVLQTVLSVFLSFAYGAIFIYIADASPNKASLGATNGLCQTTVSFMRAVGPALAASLYSLSLQDQDVIFGGRWMVYYAMFGVVSVALIGAILLPQKKGRRGKV